MADNVTANAGTGGAVFASDDIGGVQYPRAKMTWGPDGTANDADVASGKSLPVQVRSATGLIPLGEPTDAKNTATDTTSVTAISVLKQISASVQAPPSQAVTNAGTFAVQDSTAQASLSVLDDWDETDRCKVNIISGQAGVAAGAGAVGATVQRMTLASDDSIIGSLTETAPASDTASSGLNGRLQRIAQRMTSLISPGLSASVSVTRPSDTTGYTANDVVGVTGGGTATITFSLGAISGSRIMITSASLERDASALISGEANYLLHLYNVTQPGAQIDNAAFDLASGDRTAYLGSIDLGTPVDLGSTLYVGRDGINKQIKLAGTSVFGVLVTAGAYTPVSAAVHVVTLHAVQL